MLAVGLLPRTIGGPFAVLVAEQLVAAGTKVVVGADLVGPTVADSAFAKPCDRHGGPP